MCVCMSVCRQNEDYGCRQVHVCLYARMRSLCVDQVLGLNVNVYIYVSTFNIYELRKRVYVACTPHKRWTDPHRHMRCDMKQLQSKCKKLYIQRHT